MERELLDVSGDEPAVRKRLRELECSSPHLEELSLTYLTAAWEDQPQREAIKQALKGATQQLAVIDTAIVAGDVMYGMYLLATGGKARTTIRTTQKPDGSFVTEEKTTYASPREWIKAIVDLVTGGGSELFEDAVGDEG